MDAGFFQYNAVDSRTEYREVLSLPALNTTNTGKEKGMARNAATSKKIIPTASKTQNRRPLKVNFYQ